MLIHLNDYLSGGYFLVKSSPRPDWLSADLMPERILSLSDELCPSVHLRWAWDAETAHDHFGIGDLDDPIWHPWDAHPDFEYPNVFLNLETAHQYRQEFQLDITDLHLLGIGLPGDLLEAFLAGPYKQRVYDPHSGETHDLICGTGTALNRRQSLPRRGKHPRF